MNENKNENYVENDAVGISGNVVNDPTSKTIINSNNEKVSAVNFTIVAKNEQGEKEYISCSAYAEKAALPLTFKKGDFVNVFGKIKNTIDQNGKEYRNMRVLASKMLKAIEHKQTKQYQEQSVNQSSVAEPIRVNTSKEAKENLVNIKGNLSSDIKLIGIVSKTGEKMKVANFTVVSHNEDKTSVFHNCAAYGEKAVQLADKFKKGDFVKVFGAERNSVDKNGKTHKDITLLKIDMLKSREDMLKDKPINDEKPSVISQIRQYQSETKAVNKKEPMQQMPKKESNLSI